MGNSSEAGRRNQRRRTRNDLLAAAARLLRQGRTPTMDDVAAEAMISRATLYRYFPSLEALLVEAPMVGIVPGPERVFPSDDAPADPVVRIERAAAALHEACYRNEAQLRLMLAASLERTAKKGPGDAALVRQNRRTPLIEAALAPARRRFTAPAYARLRAALAVLIGTESMIVFQDVLCLDEQTARRVTRWAAGALVAAAIEESRTPSSRRPPRRRVTPVR